MNTQNNYEFFIRLQIYILLYKHLNKFTNFFKIFGKYF